MDERMLERISAAMDGEDLTALDDHAGLVSSSAEHLQRWSLIGATLRRELLATADPALAGRVRSRLDLQIPRPANDHPHRTRSGWLRLWLRSAAQAAAAAAVAGITVIGFQTYSAADVTALHLEPPAAARSGGGSSLSVDLASFQHGGPALGINAPAGAAAVRTPAAAPLTPAGSEQLRQQQERELRRINAYLRSYLLESAAR